MTTTLTARSITRTPSGGGVLGPVTDVPDATISFAGSGYGAGPAFVFFKDWGTETLGALSDTSDLGQVHTTTGVWPKVFAGWDGINGLGIREGGVTAGTNRLAGFIKDFANYTDFFDDFDMCIPDGRTFSGASTPSTLPPASNIKMVWNLDGVSDTSPEADLISMARPNSNEWCVTGNNATTPVYCTSGNNVGGNKIDFDRWMHYQTLRTAGANPSVDNGLTAITITNSEGTYTREYTAVPTFPDTAPNKYYTHTMFPGWSGNGDQELSQHLFSYWYRATGARCAWHVEVANNAVYANATARRTIPFDSWSDTAVTCSPPEWMVDGMTHAFLMNGQTIVDTIVLNAPAWVEGVAPTVSLVSGTWGEGNALTISGSNFSDEKTESFYTDFSSDTLGQFPAGFYDWNDAPAKYLVTTDGTAPVGTRTARMTAINQAMSTVHYEYGSDQSEIFVEAWVRINKQSFVSESQTGQEQIKTFRIVDGVGTSSMQARPTRLDVTYLKSSGLSAGYSPAPVTSPSWYAKNAANQDWVPNDTDWYKVVLYYKYSTLDTADGKVYMKFGDATNFTDSDVPAGHMASHSGTVAKDEYDGELIVTQDSSNTGIPPRRTSLPYFHRDDQETIIDVAHYYTANSQERVVVGNASTWSACDKKICYMLPTTSRSRGSITATAKESTTIAGSKWLYVVNHDGKINENGVAI